MSESQYTPYRLTMECDYALPTSLTLRAELYEGETDPEKCIKIDLENDPAMVMLETGFRLVAVREGTIDG